MPMVSKAQNRYWRAVAAGQAKGDKKVAREFIRSAHGKSLKRLPERVTKRQLRKRF